MTPLLFSAECAFSWIKTAVDSHLLTWFLRFVMIWLSTTDFESAGIFKIKIPYGKYSL